MGHAVAEAVDALSLNQNGFGLARRVAPFAGAEMPLLRPQPHLRRPEWHAERCGDLRARQPGRVEFARTLRVVVRPLPSNRPRAPSWDAARFRQSVRTRRGDGIVTQPECVVLLVLVDLVVQ
jgi:hypothetical protein